MTFDARAALDAILPHLDRGDAPSGQWPDGNGEYWALCPFHNDRLVGNFSVSERGFTCFSCGAAGGLKKLAEKLGVDLGNRCTVDPLQGGIDNTNFSLAAYAAAKHLPEAFLRSLGVVERKRDGKASLRMAYLDTTGQEVAVRYRIAMTGDRFRWAKGSKLHLYGLWLLDDQAPDVLLVEGESDFQTLAYHGIPALGVPGATNWRTAWAEAVQDKTVYAWQEPGAAGAQFIAKIGADLPDVRIISAEDAGYKDISEAHVAGADVPALVARLKAAAQPYRELAAEQLSAEAQAAERKASDLLRCPDILARFTETCERLGLVGETQNARLLYLALTSRLLERPVSVAVKGPSSGGKSYLTETVLRFFPESAYYGLSSMSERALAYSEEPLAHRFLVLYEAAGMTGDFASYLIRTLLSEGRIRYESVEKTADGLKPRLIEREGPTGLLVTTTWASLHPENETRMLSLVVRDDREQTRGVLYALADRANGKGPQEVDLTPWHALQAWLELTGDRAVTVPFAHGLANLADPRAVRLRRDFGAVLALIRAHAILHQKTRDRDERGRIVATLADYAAVHDLVIGIVSEGVQAAVSPTTRETVEAVANLEKATSLPVSVAKLAEHLGLDKSAASRRVSVATKEGYLINTEDKKGRPAKLIPGDPLPAEKPVLPDPALLEKILSGIPPCDVATVQHSADLEVFEL